MSFRSFFVVLMALVCGLAAAVGIKQLQGNTEGAPGAVEMVKVIVTGVHCRRGEKVTKDHVFESSWPKDQLPLGALQTLDDVIGNVVIIEMLPGDVVVEKKISNKLEGGGISPLIPPGMRAFTIPTPTPSTSVAGFLLPGNDVDVYLTMRTENNKRNLDKTGGGICVVLLKKIKIIAAGESLRPPEGNRVEQLRSVTLAVTPDDAAKLSLAKDMGTLTVALRNGSEVVKEHRASATRRELEELLFAGYETPKELPKQEVAKAKPVGPAKASKPRVEPGPPQQQFTQVRIRTIRGSARGEIRMFLYPESQN